MDEFERVQERLKTEMGETILKALGDTNVTEVMVNPDGAIWQEASGELINSGDRLPPLRVRGIINTIASMSEQVVNWNAPMLECELLAFDNARVLATCPPVTTQATLTIRKHNPHVLALSDWVKSGSLREDQAQVLEAAIADHANIVISGGTGSGKTTLANSLLNVMAEVDANQRLVVIEDTREIKSPVVNTLSFRTTMQIDMNHLLRAALRARPDRIIVGEVRGAEAWTMLKSWMTGHPGGICTIHATAAEQARLRLIHMCAESGVDMNMIESTVDEAVDLVVQIERQGSRRLVTELQHRKET